MADFEDHMEFLDGLKHTQDDVLDWLQSMKSDIVFLTEDRKQQLIRELLRVDFEMDQIDAGLGDMLRKLEE